MARNGATATHGIKKFLVGNHSATAVRMDSKIYYTYFILSKYTLSWLPQNFLSIFIILRRFQLNVVKLKIIHVFFTEILRSYQKSVSFATTEQIKHLKIYLGLLHVWQHCNKYWRHYIQFICENFNIRKPVDQSKRYNIFILPKM